MRPLCANPGSEPLGPGGSFGVLARFRGHDQAMSKEPDGWTCAADRELMVRANSGRTGPGGGRGTILQMPGTYY